MWEFIKYCFYCLGIIISAGFGDNPPGLTWKTGIVGTLTLLVLFALTIGILYLRVFILKKTKWKNR